MSCCYDVSMSLRATDESAFVRASHEYYEKVLPLDKSDFGSRHDVESIMGYVVFDMCMDDIYHNHDTITVRKYKTGRVYLSTGFNAYYVWMTETMNWFEAATPFLADNSWLIIYGEGDYVVRM